MEVVPYASIVKCSLRLSIAIILMLLPITAMAAIGDKDSDMERCHRTGFVRSRRMGMDAVDLCHRQKSEYWLGTI